MFMSGEQLTDTSVVKDNEKTFVRSDLEKPSVKNHNRVDINDLLSKVREEKKKQRKENLIFFGLVSSVIVTTGVIASL